MIKYLKIDLPDLYLEKGIDRPTLEKIVDSNTNIIKKIFMLQNEVKPDYYFLDTFTEEYDICAKIIPNFVFIGEARNQLKSNNLLNRFKDHPYFRIKASIWKSNNYEKLWEYNELVKDKKKIYKLIPKLKEIIENKIRKNDFKNWKQGTVSQDITAIIEHS
tara:strand:- start:1523 stop:2005 length:483 start_codon:yes stop_codon:yes gene_type:complete